MEATLRKKSESLPGLRRGVEILERLAATDQGLGFNDLKAHFDDLAPSTLSRLLKVLLEEGLIEHDAANRHYALGSRALDLGQTVCGHLTTAQRVAPVVEELAHRTQLSAAFFELQGEIPVLVKKIEMPESFHYGPEGITPLNYAHHAFSMVCVAYAADEVAAEVRKRLKETPPGRHPHPLDRSWQAYEEELAAIRHDRILVNLRDDQQGLKRIAAPVLLPPNNRFAGAIGVSFFHAFDSGLERSYTAAVRQAADAAAAVLG
jgi:DNA-binding IclR family transcriptional regulator